MEKKEFAKAKKQQQQQKKPTLFNFLIYTFYTDSMVYLFPKCFFLLYVSYCHSILYRLIHRTINTFPDARLKIYNYSYITKDL